MAEPALERQATEKLVTADELLAMPDDGRRRELIRGRLVEMAPPGAQHCEVVGNLYVALRVWSDAHLAGRVYPGDAGVWVSRDPDTVLAPDISFVSRARFPGPSPEGFLEIVPELVVEVVSPNDTQSEVSAKTGEWLDAGVTVVWVVWPRHRRITIHRSHGDAHALEGDAVLTEPDLLPGFELPLDQVFV